MHAQRLLPLLAGLAAGLAGCGGAKDAPGPAPEGELQTYSYALGVQLAAELAPVRGEIDLRNVHQALDDSLRYQAAHLTPDQARATINQYEETHHAARADLWKVAGERNLLAGSEFLSANGKRAGVETTPAGVQYEVLQRGEGQQPQATDQVMVHYTGTLADGSVFDDSRSRPLPVTIAIPAALAGWQEVLPLMSVGSRYRVWIPGPLAFGARGFAPKVGPQAAVVYEMELLAVVR